MQWVLILVGAVLILIVVGFVIQALKWLLIVAAIVALIGVISGALPRSRSRTR